MAGDFVSCFEHVVLSSNCQVSCASIVWHCTCLSCAADAGRFMEQFNGRATRALASSQTLQDFNMSVVLQNGHVGATPGFDGDHVKALASIKAKALVMPAERDLYFPAADDEFSKMPNAELRVIRGRFAGDGGNQEDTKFIDNAIKELLSTPVTDNRNNRNMYHMHTSAQRECMQCWNTAWHHLTLCDAQHVLTVASI